MLLHLTVVHLSLLFFFFNDTATTEIYTLSLHDALPISQGNVRSRAFCIMSLRVTMSGKVKSIDVAEAKASPNRAFSRIDRKSTRLNSSHVEISYAVFCLKKKKKKKKIKN